MSSKIVIGVLGTAVVGLGLYWFLGKSNNNKKQDNQEKESKKSEPEIITNPQVKQLSKHLNKDQPSQTQMHQLYKIIVTQSQSKNIEYIENFKKQRRIILVEDFAKYLRYVRDSLIQIKNIDIRVKEQILQQLNMTQQQFDNAAMKFSDSLEETQSQFLKGKGGVIQIQQLKKAMKIQKQILLNQGPLILQKVNKQVKTWKSQQKQWIEQIINVVFQDQTLKVLPYDSEVITRSSVMYKNQLLDQIIDLRNTLTQLLMNMQYDGSEQHEDQSDDNYQHQILDKDNLIGMSRQSQFQQLMDSAHNQ